MLSPCPRSAVIEHTNRVIFLEDDDVAAVVDGRLSIHRVKRTAGDHPGRAVQTLQMELQQIMKGEGPCLPAGAALTPCHPCPSGDRGLERLWRCHSLPWCWSISWGKSPHVLWDFPSENPQLGAAVTCCHPCPEWGQALLQPGASPSTEVPQPALVLGHLMGKKSSHVMGFPL